PGSQCWFLSSLRPAPASIRHSGVFQHVKVELQLRPLAFYLNPRDQTWPLRRRFDGSQQPAQNPSLTTRPPAPVVSICRKRLWRRLVVEPGCRKRRTRKPMRLERLSSKLNPKNLIQSD